MSTHVQVTSHRKEGESRGPATGGCCQDGVSVQQGEVQVSDPEEDLMIHDGPWPWSRCGDVSLVILNESHKSHELMITVRDRGEEGP